MEQAPIACDTRGLSQASKEGYRVCREKAELKRTQLQERIAAGEQVRERVPAVAVPDDEDVEWQQLVAANRDAGCLSSSVLPPFHLVLPLDIGCACASS